MPAITTGDVQTPVAPKTPKMSDDELQQATQTIVEKAKALWQKRHGLDPANPEHQQQISSIDAELLQNRKALTDLYHPHKNPGALQRVGRFFKGLGSDNFWNTVGEAAATMEGDKSNQAMFAAKRANTPEARAKGALAEAQGTPATPTATNKMEEVKKAYKATFGVDMPNDKAQQFFNHLYGGAPLEPKPEAENWVPATVKFADGTEATLQRNSKTGEWTDLAGNAVPRERLSTAKIAPKTTGQPKVAWKKLPNGRYVSMQLDENNHFKPGTENYDQIPPANIVGRISTSNFHYQDEKGQIHQVQETRTSTPMGQGGAGVPGATPSKKTPGQQKKDLQGMVSGSGKDKVIGFKGSKDYVDTKTSYEAAIDRTDTMGKNLANGLKGDQQAMLSLVANHIGMTLGVQKGARITRAVWEEAIQSTPWFARIAAKFDDRGYLSGVTLAPEQMKQMVRLAHEKTQTLKEHLDRLDKERGATPSVETDDDAIIKALRGAK